MANFKTEGTSQTYGQLIIFPFKKDSLPTSRFQYPNSSKETIVKLMSSTKDRVLGRARALTLADIDDVERTKIIQTAFSDNPNAAIEIAVGINSGDGAEEESVPDQVNLAAHSEKIESFAIVVGGEKSREELKKIIKDSSVVDLFIMLKSLDSEEAEFNNLKESQIESNFVYNYFTQTEEDIEFQENQINDPLLVNNKYNAPMYVKLTWPIAKITEPVSIEDTNSGYEQLRFTKPKGISSIKSNSFTQSIVENQNKINPISVTDGIKQQIVDIHAQDKAFNNIVNNLRFSNTINVNLFAQNLNMKLNNLPFMEIIKGK